MIGGDLAAHFKTLLIGWIVCLRSYVVPSDTFLHELEHAKCQTETANIYTLMQPQYVHWVRITNVLSFLGYVYIEC